MIKLEAGQIVRFTYSHPPEGVDEGTGDRYKEVLVLQPNWRGRLHGIDLKRLTQAEREVLHAILDERQAADAKSGKRPHRFPLVNDVLRRMDPLEEIKNPVSFYVRFVKVFLRNKDAYRTYSPVHMSAVTVVKKTDVRGHVINPKPMFGDRSIFSSSAEKETEPTKPTKPLSRLDLIKQRAQTKKNQ